MNNKKIKLYFFSLSPTGIGLSGGDRIFIELAREWSKKVSLKIYTTGEGVDMMKRQNLSGKYLDIEKIENSKLPTNFFFNYIYKILLGIKLGLELKLNMKEYKAVLYSASDFWMDVFPAVLLKIRYPKLTWVGTWYQTAPNPLKGFREGDREKSYNYSAFLYWFSQLIVKPLIKIYADKVIVNNEDEKKRFPSHTKNKNSIVLIGAVPLTDIKKYLSSHKAPAKKEYDAVFQGRFHPQKGVVEIIEIWGKVVRRRPKALLGMIGDGPLMKDVKLKIKNLKLKKNINLLGYVFDGPTKYKFFASGKIVLHPAFYDSGGMASAEAMAFGIPCIGFDLKAYKSYYPKGMVKVPIGDLSSFANEAVKLLENNEKRKKVGREAKRMIEKTWSWEYRAKEILEKINE